MFDCEDLMNIFVNLFICFNNLYKVYLLIIYKILINGLNYVFMNIIINMNFICVELSFCVKNDECIKCFRN